jgi:hypothetical protein
VNGWSNKKLRMNRKGKRKKNKIKETQKVGRGKN